MSRHPEVLWAQRSSVTTPDKNIVYLTVNLPNITESTLKYELTPAGLSFKATTAIGERTEYAFDLDFYAEVDPEKSTRHLTSRSLAAVLRKKESQSEYWPRLTKEKIKTSFIKTDFSKWVDEEEQDGNPTRDDDLDPAAMSGMGMGGDMDFSKLMAQAGDFGGDPTAAEPLVAESDSDEEGPPPLEDAEPVK